MAKDINEVLDRYTPPVGPVQLCNMSCKIDLEAKILLEGLAEHLGAKKTKLFVQLAEAAIHQAFEAVQDDKRPELLDWVSRRSVEEVES